MAWNSVNIPANTRKSPMNDENTDPKPPSVGNNWYKGMPSPNPSGRPAGLQETATLIREALRKRIDAETAAQLADTLVTHALRGNAKMYSILARVHSLMTDNVNVRATAVSWNWQPGGGRSAPVPDDQVEETEEDKE